MPIVEAFGKRIAFPDEMTRPQIQLALQHVASNMEADEVTRKERLKQSVRKDYSEDIHAVIQALGSINSGVHREIPHVDYTKAFDSLEKALSKPEKDYTASFDKLSELLKKLDKTIEIPETDNSDLVTELKEIKRLLVTVTAPKPAIATEKPKPMIKKFHIHRDESGNADTVELVY